MKGKYAYDRFEFQRAIQFLAAAVKKDSTFARAHALLAITRYVEPTNGTGSLDSALVLARWSLSKAVAADASLPMVAVAQADIQLGEWNFPEADRTAAKALAANPTDEYLHALRCNTFGLLGQVQAAVAECRRAANLDPLNVANLQGVQVALYTAGEFRGAINATPRILELDPGNIGFWANIVLGLSYGFVGRPDSAVLAIERGVRVDSAKLGGRMFLVMAYAAAGRWREAREQRARLEREPAGNSPNFRRLSIHIAFNQLDSAMTDLERAVAEKEPLYLNDWVSCDPYFNPLKKDPRFAAVMTRLGSAVCPSSGNWAFTSPPN